MSNPKYSDGTPIFPNRKEELKDMSNDEFLSEMSDHGLPLCYGEEIANRLSKGRAAIEAMEKVKNRIPYAIGLNLNNDSHNMQKIAEIISDYKKKVGEV
jgi:hypothetical protein